VAVRTSAKLMLENLDELATPIAVEMGKLFRETASGGQTQRRDHGLLRRQSGHISGA
jgi:hypothetical protein